MHLHIGTQAYTFYYILFSFKGLILIYILVGMYTQTDFFLWNPTTLYCWPGTASLSSSYSLQEHTVIDKLNYPTNETFHFLKTLLLCHKFLRVGVMSIKVYIFGEEIHVWSHILFLKLPVYEKNMNIRLFCPKIHHGRFLGQMLPFLLKGPELW